MSLITHGFLRRLVGLYPKQKAQTRSGDYAQPIKPWPRPPTVAEQGLMVAVDDVREKLQDLTRTLQARTAASAEHRKELDYAAFDPGI